MITIPVSKLPNQIFSIIINGIDYQIALRTIQELTYMSLWANGEILFYNQLCVPNEWINPYNYLSLNGKFRVDCVDDEYPYFEKFNDTQLLNFYTPEEVQNA